MIGHGVSSGRRALEGLAFVVGELASLDRLAGAGGQLEQEAQVVQRQQAESEQLVLVDEVADVGAREARAGRAVAALVERAPGRARSGRCGG